MLNNARSEDSHVKTVSLARGTVATPPGSAHSSAAQTPLASAARSGDVSRRFLERSSLGRSQSPAELMKPPSSSGGDGDPMSGMLSQIGVTELLEQDDRPTFVVDLADSGNYGPGQLNLVFANSSLKSYTGMQELVTGAAGDAGCSPGSATNTFLQFKSWLLSASVNGESLNVCLPSFAFGGLNWSCSTLRKRLRIIAGAFGARATPPTSTRTKASIPSPAQRPDPISVGPSALEPLDYFTGTPSQVPAADGPSGGSNKAEVVPTIEAHAPPQDLKMTQKERNNARGLIANNAEHDLSVATELLPSTQTYVPPSRPSPTPSSVEGTLLMRTPTSSTIDSSVSQIPIVQPDVPSFDWTSLPITEEMPRHIRSINRLGFHQPRSDRALE
ncbi:hypothetical protein KC364_g558 [Hortaea werneckii]|nr:hypothetical protein KC364_g558 [Hortaea werneckii]